MITEGRQAVLLAKYPHLIHYHIGILNILLGKVDLAGKSVLEIGGNNYPEEILLGDLGARRWISVNRDIFQMTPGETCRPLAEATGPLPETGRCIYQGHGEDVPASFDGQFDVVFALAVLEHVLHMPKLLRRVYDTLRPGGVFFAHYGPIWSCSVGHHLWLDDNHFNFKTPGILPPYSHLLMTPFELYRWSKGRYGESKADEIVYKVHEDPFINRLMVDDYPRYFEDSPFGTATVFENHWTEPTPTPELAWKLARQYPDCSLERFSIGGVNVTAIKKA